MMSDWKECTIGEIASVKGGKRLPKGVNLITEQNDHPYIRIRDLTEKTLELKSSYEYVDNETQKCISRYIVGTGDILISIVGTIGLVAVVGESLNGANLTENCVKLIDIREDVDREYLYYFLVSNMGQDEIKKGTVGAVQPKLPIKNIQSIKLYLPHIDIQKRISGLLSAIDCKIAQNTAINENLEQQAQALFKAWFVDFEPFGGVMTDDWRMGTFSEIIESTLGGDWGKEAPTGNYTERVFCIRGADIPEVKAGNKGKMPTRYILPKNFSNKKLVADDIVVEISGGSPTQSTGRVAAISQSLLDRYDSGMICTNFCRAIKPCEGYSNFLYYYWQYLYDRKVFFSYENGTTGIKNLDLSGFIETEPIIIPSVQALDEFNCIVSAFYSQIFENGQENEHLATVRDTLLPKLMNGEIDVSTVQI